MKLLHLLFIALAFQAIIIISVVTESKAQVCSGTVSNGQNLVTNGDFSGAYTGWTFQSPDYTQFTPCGSSCYSVPGKIYAGDKSTDFNQAFNLGTGVNIPDHSSTSDNMMLMVDGVCTSGIDLWKQTNIPIAANTNYYFTVWITTLTTPTPHGTLQFVINGTPLSTTITATNTIGQWTQFTAVWASGATPPATATIEIQNTTTTGCNSAVDFAIDDISFSPGCDFGSAGPEPDLGPDFTICGKTTPFNINPNFTPAVAAQANINYTWYKNGVIQVSKTGLGPAFYNYSVTGPGTYAVCAQEGGNCPKTDIVVITSSFTIDLGPPILLCNPVVATLDAGYSGPGVKYRWYKSYPTRVGGNDSAQTITVNQAGTYRVDVVDPICGTQSGTVTITSNAATPNNATYCSATTVSMSVSGAGKYKWWTAATGGTVLTTGPTYNKTGIVSPTNYTFYVEDTSTFSLTAGPSAAANNSTHSCGTLGVFCNPFAVDGSTKSKLIFNAKSDFVLDQISVFAVNYYCSGGVNDKVTVNVKYPSSLGGGHVPGSPKTILSPCTVQNNGPNFPAHLMPLPLGFAILQADGYQMTLSTSSGESNIIGFLNANSSGTLPSPPSYIYPTMYSYAGNPVVEFASNSSSDFNLYYQPTAFPGYFDWQITKGINCQRVPVMLTHYCALPVDYLNFTVKPQSSSSALIKWQTASELNADRFVVMRSYDGIHYTEIGTVKATGNSNSIQSYSYTDYGLISGTVYYKIAEYDFDNSARYTDVKSINVYLNKMTVYPNPTKGSVTVSLVSGLGNNITIEVINSIGQTLSSKTVSSGTDFFEQDIDLQGFNSGVYFLKVQSGTERWLEKVVKE